MTTALPARTDDGRFQAVEPVAMPEPWASASAAWVTALTGRGLAPATVESYARHVVWLARDVGHLTGPWEMTRELVAGWLTAQSWSVTTRRRVLNSLRSFYAHGLDTGQMQRSPLVGVGLPNRRRGPEPLPMPAAWSDAANEWRDWMLAGGRGAGTLHVRLRWLRALAESYADPWTVSAGDLAVFLSRSDWSPEYRRQGHTSLRGFYGWAERAEYVSTSPARHLSTVLVPRTVPRPAPDDAVSLALARATDRTRLAIYLGAYAGLRRAEIAAVHCHDIGLGALRVKGKGGHERLVPLHPDLEAALRAELRQRRDGIAGTGWAGPADPEGWLFPAEDPDQHLTPQWVGALVQRALPAGWTTHHLRHRFATQAYAVERDLRAVQELLGHRSPTTTTRYAAVPTEAVAHAVSGIPTLPTAAHRIQYA